MRARLALGRPLTAALLATLAPSSFCFWGPALVALPTTVPGPEPGSEMWLDAPIEPVVSVHERAAPGPAGGAGRNPFVKASERVRPLPVAVAWTYVAPRTSGYPRLKAVVRIRGEQVALLEDQVARVGDRVAGVVVLQVDERRVLVRGAAGTRWLELVPGEEP